LNGEFLLREIEEQLTVGYRVIAISRVLRSDSGMQDTASTSARGESSLSVGSGTNVSITSAGMRSGKSILSGGSSGTNAADTIAGMGAGELTLSDGSETDTIAGMGAGELTLSDGSETDTIAGMGARAWRSSDIVSLSFR